MWFIGSVALRVFRVFMGFGELLLKKLVPSYHDTKTIPVAVDPC